MVTGEKRDELLRTGLGCVLTAPHNGALATGPGREPEWRAPPYVGVKREGQARDGSPKPLWHQMPQKLKHWEHLQHPAVELTQPSP